jgi:protocatechuate 3,4-dioxygenase beta subunit
LGAQTQQTDENGGFAFDVDDMRDQGEATRNAEGVWVPRYRPDALTAVKKGRLPARVELPPLAELRRTKPAPEFTLVLTGEPLEIAGRVLEPAGTPVEGAMVRLTDETPFGMIVEKIGGEGIGLSTSTEALLRGSSHTVETRTQKDGSFTLGGLLDREYRVVAFDKRTLRRAESAPIRAGRRDAEIRLDDCSACVRIAGTVVGLDGTPVPGVSVGLGAVIDDTRAPVYAAQTETDEAGRFVFESVVADAPLLSVTHASIFFVFGWKPDPKTPLDELEIPVARKAHVQVDLGTDTARADEFGLIDARGEPVEMVMSRGNIMWMPERVDVVDGKSETVGCAENGAMVVLYKEKQEVARIPVRLVPGEITTVRP